jgi:hypothetical protein
MKFTEEKLENAFIELLGNENGQVFRSIKLMAKKIKMSSLFANKLDK